MYERPSIAVTTVRDTICHGETYTWSADGNPYTATTTTSVILPSVHGCDSIVTLELIVNESYAVDTIAVACDVFEWYGTPYTTTGKYPKTFTTVAGCDSIVTLDLTINKSVHIEKTVSACGSYEWNGMKYDQSGDYTFHGTTVTGCDSVVTLHLTVTQAVYNEETIVACGSYTWNGETYDQSGEYTYNGTTENGCDSIVTLYLTINKPVYREETIVACESYDWNGQTYTATGDYSYTTTAKNGCDSIVTLHLTVNHPTYGDTTATIYTYELPYQWYEMSLTEAGDYTRVWGANAAGCDSIVTLHLIVNETVVRVESNIVDTVCPGTSYQGRLSTKTINDTEIWTDSVHTLVAGVPTDSLYKYTIIPYVISTIEEPLKLLALCGKPIDVSIAEGQLNDFIASEPLYAPNVDIEWYEHKSGTWVELSKDAIDGLTTTVTVKYVISTDCKTVESEPIVLQVERPSPENDVTMANAPALSKYGNRLLLIDLKQIENDFGWTISEKDVTWYKVVDEIDNYADSTALRNDIIVGYGYYYTSEDGQPLVGTYYARIENQPISTDECGGTLQTVLLNCIEMNLAPVLVPTVAQPYELIKLMNLDPSLVSTISVYSTAGELLNTYQVTNETEMTFNAAHVAGYYIVEIQTETEKVSLRYVVK